MAYAFPGETSLDYFPCRYGDSKVLMRGPYRAPRGDYCVALGGTETYGRLVAHPWPDVLEQVTGRMTVNLGLPNSGPDLYLNDPALLSVMRKAARGVVQVFGPVNLTNRFYSVHPRRNDRVLRVLPALKALYPEVDFIEFNFTNHLVSRLVILDPERFEPVRQELRQVWIDRVGTLLAQLPAPVVLLWLGEMPPAQASNSGFPAIDRAMITAAAATATLVEVPGGTEAAVEPVPPGEPLLVNALHGRIAAVLARVLAGHPGTKTGARRRP